MQNVIPDQHSALLRLDPADNVAMAKRDLAAGERVPFAGAILGIERHVPTGHKVAVARIESGARIFKFRVSIGSATEAIAPGAYVHTHNMKSDYIPTFTFEAGRQFEEGKA
jgi:altronate dehydratase small subunit